MHNEYVIKEIVTILPSQLNQLTETVHQKVRERVGTCSRDYGYIVRVSCIRIESNLISRTSGNVFVTVWYTAVCIKPVENEVIDCVAVMIMPEGVLSKYGKMHVFIPEETASVGDWLSVEILSFRFDQSEYQCIGRLKK